MVYDDDFGHILPGNKVVLTGELLPHEGPSNLGENDMRIYYLSRNIGFTMFPDKKEILGQEKKFWKSRLFSLRNRMSKNLSLQYDEKIRPMFEAMIAGRRRDLPQTERGRGSCLSVRCSRADLCFVLLCHDRHDRFIEKSPVHVFFLRAVPGMRTLL